MHYIDNQLKGSAAMPKFTVRVLQNNEFFYKTVNVVSSYGMWGLLVYLALELLRNQSIETVLYRNDLLLVALILGFFAFLMGLE